jgi:holo-[acyl-carrier protein] synthase
VTEPTVEFNVGIDLEPVSRFSSTLDDPSLAGLFTPGEHAQCAGWRDAAGRYAGLWCAKEAAIKALWPWVRLDSRRVEIVPGDDFASRVVVSGWDPSAHGVAVRVNTSHSRSHAVASAVAWGPPISPRQEQCSSHSSMVTGTVRPPR